MKNIFIEKYNSFLSSKSSLFRFVFIGLIFSIYFSSILNVTLFEYVLTHDAGIYLAIMMFLVLICNYFIIYSVFCFSIFGKIILSIIIIASAFANYYMFVSGNVIGYDVIESVFQTNQREAMELIGIRWFIFVILASIFPLFIIWTSKIKFTKILYNIVAKLLGIIVSLIIAGFVVWINYGQFAPYARHHDFGSYINFDNYTFNIYRVVRNSLAKPKILQIIDDNPVRANQNKSQFVLLLIGETSRSASYSINGYERKTNPYLEKEDLINFPYTTSCGTYTALSVPCMFSHLTRREYNEKLYAENVLDLLKKTGVNITWYENDDGCKGVCSRINTINVQKREHKLCHNKECKDEVFLEDLTNEIQQFSKIKGVKNQIVAMHMIGSHGPLYYLRYPRKFAKFTPECTNNNPHQCTKEELFNAYENTIIYQDWIIHEMINKLKQMKKIENNKNVEITLIYLSDHGESLGENNTYMHGFPYAMAPKEQKEIPFFIWTTDVKLKKKLSSKTKQKVSHDNLFHTLLGLFSVSSKVKDNSLDLTF